MPRTNNRYAASSKKNRRNRTMSSGRIRRNRHYTGHSGSQTAITLDTLVMSDQARDLVLSHNSTADVQIAATDIAGIGTGANQNIKKDDVQKYIAKLNVPQENLLDHKFESGAADYAIQNQVTPLEIARRSTAASPVTLAELETIVSGRL